MMRKRPSSGNTSNPNSVVVFEDPSSKSGSSSEDSNGNGHAIMKNRKRSRPDFVKKQDSQYENSMNEGGSRGFSSRSISSDIYGVMCCKDRCTNRSQSWLYTALIILLGGAACTSVIVLGLQSTKLSSQKLFQNQAAEVVFSLNSSWREYETALLWIHQSCDPRATATDASSSHTHNVSISDHDGFCSRPEFDSLTRHIDSLHLQVVSIQFAPSITHDQRPALEEESAEYYASLSNRTSSNISVSYPYLGITNVAFDADTGDVFERILAPEESVYFPVHYIHPLSEERNQALIEMDLYGIPEIRDDIDRALRDFQPVMGDRFRIPMEEDDGQDDVLLWAIGIIHPGIDEQLMDEHVIPTDGHHHSVSRIELRPADLIQRSISSLDFPEDGGMSVYIFDATVDVEANASSEPIFLAALDRLDDGTLSHLEEINFESVNELEEPYTFQNARIHQGTIDVANHQWTIVVVPTGAAYSPSFDFVVLGSLLVFLATVLVTCLYQRSNARANEMRSLKSEQTREKAKTALLQAQRERHLVRSEPSSILLCSFLESCFISHLVYPSFRTIFLHMRSGTLFRRLLQR
jgi:CHASE domain